MKEVWKYRFDHKGKFFDLKAFETLDGYLMKIFYEEKVVNEFAATMSNQVKQEWEIYKDSEAFDALATAATEWVREADNNKRFD